MKERLSEVSCQLLQNFPMHPHTTLILPSLRIPLALLLPLLLPLLHQHLPLRLVLVKSAR